MSKRNKIIYWVATLWLSLGMISTGIVQLMKLPEETAFITKMGYPEFLLPFLGITKFLGVIVVLIPRYPLAKEWAYAGFFFMMSGAIYSHVVIGGAIGEIAPPLLLLVLTVISWRFRPAERKIAELN